VNVIIRQARDGELDEIIELDKAILDGAFWDHEKDEAFWVAMCGEQIVAYAAARASRYFPGEAYLSRAGVVPEFRGHGLQKRLIRARLAWARRAGLKAAYTYTLRNPASANSLIACGFRSFYPGPRYDVDRQWWRRKL
jgi:GNAT superfamily N-acetyltransferase